MRCFLIKFRKDTSAEFDGELCKCGNAAKPSAFALQKGKKIFSTRMLQTSSPETLTCASRDHKEENSGIRKSLFFLHLIYIVLLSILLYVIYFNIHC